MFHPVPDVSKRTGTLSNQQSPHRNGRRIRYNLPFGSGFRQGPVRFPQGTPMLRATPIAPLALLSACAIFRAKSAAPPAAPRLALALGDGAARGFAPIGVIKAPEA